MAKLLGRATAKPEAKLPPRKTQAEATPRDRDEAKGASELTLAERLQLHSVAGSFMAIKGELVAAEDLTIDGRVEGTISHTANRLTIGKSGVVKASIHAQSLIVEGRVKGDIECQGLVVLTKTAKVKGNIHTARLNIADGAQFNGKIVMVEASEWH